MKAPYLHYTFFKKVTLNIESMIKKEIEYDDNLIFNLANFNNIGYFYSLKSFKDKYQFTDKLNEKFDEFIVECLLNIEKHNNYNQLFFLYSLVASNTLEKYLNKYLESIENDKLNDEEIYKMIDFSISSKDNIDISKNNLYKIFKNSFEYYDYMDELIHNPCIKLFRFMASTNYFKRCYKNKKKYYKSFMKTNLRYPIHLLVSKMFRSKKRTKDMLYNDPRDTDIPLITDGMLDIAYKDVMKKIEAINAYLFDDKESDLRKEFNIDNEQKL